MDTTQKLSPLQLKIRSTALFSPQEKVDLIIGLSSMTDDQKTQLEKTIDEYDSQHNTLVSEFKNETIKQLDELDKKVEGDEEVKHASDLMRQSLNQITPADK